MTIRFYLKDGANVGTRSGYKGSPAHYHPATQLAVYSDVNGFYVSCDEDLATLKPRKDLLDSVARVSGLFRSEDQAHLGLPSGAYTFEGQPATTSISIGKKDWRAGKKSDEAIYYREMTVVADTWEAVVNAMKKIHSGEITPKDETRTAFQTLGDELARTKEELALARQTEESLRSRVNEFNVALWGVGDLLSGCCATFSLPGGFARTRDAIRAAKKSVDELADLKETRWYPLYQKTKGWWESLSNSSWPVG